MLRTIGQVRAAFWDAHPEFGYLFRTKKRQNEYPCDVRMAWCDYVESLHRNGEISDALVERVTL